MNSSKAAIRRLRTGVPGLDEVLGGGPPEFSFNLIAGPPGSGKTTLAHQIMFAAATPEYPALYFTVLGEPPLKMLRYQQQFTFFDCDRVNQCIRFVNLGDDTASGDFNKVLGRIASEVEAHGAALVFVDSFRSVLLAGHGGGNSFINSQDFIQHLGMLMTSLQATTFLIGEYHTESESNPVFTRRRRHHRPEPERVPQLLCPEHGNYEDAWAAHHARAAYVSHQRHRTQRVCAAQHSGGR
jgi:circadian clock protein KaiC